MNDLAFKNCERLAYAARRLARDVAAMRSELGLVNLYQELYAAREARLSAVTRARCALRHWLRENPDCTTAQVRKILATLDIPQSREELTEAIRAIERQAIADVRKAKKK